MIKKLAVPALMLTLATFGCSSSPSSGTGTGGTSGATGGSVGHTGGTTGTAGSSAGGNGGTAAGGHAGSSAGGNGGTAAGGHAGSSAGGHAGSSAGGNAGSSAGGHAGSSAGGNGGSSAGGAGGVQVMASTCTVTMQNGTDVLAASDFCKNLLANCPAANGYTDMGTCVQTYMSHGIERQNCQSYHLCWGVEGITNPAGPGPATHCQHAQGLAICVGDASP